MTNPLSGVQASALDNEEPPVKWARMQTLGKSAKLPVLSTDRQPVASDKHRVVNPTGSPRSGGLVAPKF